MIYYIPAYFMYLLRKINVILVYCVGIHAYVLFYLFYRNPDGDENGPWCFTVNGDIIDVEYCGIPHCQGILI